MQRRRTVLGSVAEVAKWLLPSWTGIEPEGSPNDQQPSASGFLSSQHGRYITGNNLQNGERGAKRARLNNDSNHSSNRRGKLPILFLVNIS